MRLAVLFIAGSVAVASAQITLNDGTAVGFGDKLFDLQVWLKEKPIDVDRGRPGVDQLLALTTAELGFDTERLWRVTLNERHLFPKPPAPFAEPWKNFTPIGERKLGFRMKRADFDGYLAAWRARAEAAGKFERTDYWIKSSGGLSDGTRITITFAPRRRLLGTGTLIGDTASFQFSGTLRESYRPVGTLEGVTFTSDAFRTLGRETAASAAPAAPRPRAAPPVRLEDGTELYFGQDQAEVERLLGAKAMATSTRPGSHALSLARLSLPQVGLTFDAGRLAAIDYRQMTDPPAPFPEFWKNLVPLAGRRVTPGMTKEQFDEYIALWHERAAELGMRLGRDYYVRASNSERVQSLMIGLPPSGVSVGGRHVADTWQFSFNQRGEPPNRRWALITVMATRGALSSSPPTLAQQRKSDLDELAREMPEVEVPGVPVPKIELPKVESPAPR